MTMCSNTRRLKFAKADAVGLYALLGDPREQGLALWALGFQTTHGAFVVNECADESNVCVKTRAQSPL